MIEKMDPKRDGSTLDLTAQNLQNIGELFPECMEEGKVNFEVLRQLLGDDVDDEEERYSFTWHGKTRSRRIAQTPSTGTLLPVRKDSVDWDTTRNLFMEGDNLEVLKLLQKSFSGALKMIYIDPPYNTGKEFIYPDKYQDNLQTYLQYTNQVDRNGFKLSANSETNGRYHTNWLNMMFPRLKLARNLLKDDGVIFVSIDDHEVHNLRHMMDEIFGQENFIATVIWQKVYSPKNSARHFSEDHDFVLVYARNREIWSPELLPRTDEQNAAYTNPDNDPRGPWKADNFTARNYYSKGMYGVICPSGRVINGPPSGAYWRYSEQRFKELDKDNRIWWGEDGNNVPAIKRFLTEVKQGRVPQTLWTYKQVGHTQDAKRELLEHLSFESSDSVFDTPKPTRLILQMLHIGTTTDEEDLVLDFFAGSGTTGEAVMKLNAEDGGNRRFLLVQLPEETGAGDYATIAEITKARLRAAGASLRTETPSSEDDTADTDASQTAKTLDTGFRAFKLAASNIKAWDAEFDSLESDLLDMIENIRSDRTEEDVLFELLLKYGVDPAASCTSRNLAGQKVFVIDSGKLVVCLGGRITLDVVERIAELKTQLQPKVMRVVFRDNGFVDDVVKTNAALILKRAGITDVKSL